MPRKAASPTKRMLEDEHTKCTAQEGGCQIQDLFRLLGKSHTLDILHLFVVQEPSASLRFVEVQNTLKLSPNTLSERLKELVDSGLLARTAYNEIPPRVDYQATKKARELEPVFGSLVDWARRNSLTAEQPPAVAAQAVG